MDIGFRYCLEPLTLTLVLGAAIRECVTGGRLDLNQETVHGDSCSSEREYE